MYDDGLQFMSVRDAAIDDALALEDASAAWMLCRAAESAFVDAFVAAGGIPTISGFEVGGRA